MQKQNASTPNICQTRCIESEFQALTYFPLMSFIAAGPNIELTCRKGLGKRKGEGWKWGIPGKECQRLVFVSRILVVLFRVGVDCLFRASV